MPTETFTATSHTPASVNRAWTALQRAETWAAIGGVDEITSAVHDADGNLVSFELAAIVAGKRYPGTARTVHSDPPTSMTIEIDTSELAGTLSVVLTPETSAVVDVAFTIRSKGFVSSVFFPAIATAVGSGLPRDVAAFAARLAD